MGPLRQRLRRGEGARCWAGAGAAVPPELGRPRKENGRRGRKRGERAIGELGQQAEMRERGKMFIFFSFL